MNLIKASSLTLGDPNITGDIGLLLFLLSVLSHTLACFSLLSQARAMKSGGKNAEPILWKRVLHPCCAQEAENTDSKREA